MSSKAFRCLRARGLSRLLITCEHASARLPARLRIDAATRRLLATHRGCDLGVWPVARDVSERLDATAVAGVYSRLLVDLNRHPADRALILRAVDGVRVSFNAGLSPAAAGERVARYHVPYHAEIDRQMARRVAAGTPPLLLSFHSFTPTLGGERRSFDAGVLFSDHASLARRLGALMRAEGFSVRYNRPYSGIEGLIYSAERHGAHHRTPFLELELNQALLGRREARLDVARRTARAVRGLLAGLAPPRRGRA